MTAFTAIGLVALGLLAGFFSGLIGVGGGVIIVPALILLFGYDQHTAQGTTLALLVPPIGLLAASTYFQNGYVDVRAAFFICLGFVVGGLLGGKIAVGLPQDFLKKILAVVLIMLGVKMLFFHNGKP